MNVDRPNEEHPEERIDILERQLEDLCKGVLKMQENIISLQEAVITLQKSAIKFKNDTKRRMLDGKDQT